MHSRAVIFSQRSNTHHTLSSVLLNTRHFRSAVNSRNIVHNVYSIELLAAFANSTTTQAIKRLVGFSLLALPFSPSPHSESLHPALLVPLLSTHSCSSPPHVSCCWRPRCSGEYDIDRESESDRDRRESSRVPFLWLMLGVLVACCSCSCSPYSRPLSYHHLPTALCRSAMDRRMIGPDRTAGRHAVAAQLRSYSQARSHCSSPSPRCSSRSSSDTTRVMGVVRHLRRPLIITSLLLHT